MRVTPKNKDMPNLTVILCLAFSVATAAVSAEQQNESAPCPNILLIMSDDMGISDLGCYGGEIDALVLHGGSCGEVP